MFTSEQREALRSKIVQSARADPRITGGAITGSASLGQEDRWSDVDLAFGVREGDAIQSTLEDFTALMYREFEVIHHLDVASGNWIYRVFLLANTLQVDLAFAPQTEFGARGPAFELAFGDSKKPAHIEPAPSEHLIGMGWLYALHARSSLLRGKPWQAEFMMSAMRDQILALACLRHNLPVEEARGTDRLPADITKPLEATLVSSLVPDELYRAFRAAAAAFLAETRLVNRDLASRLEPALLELSQAQSAGSIM